MHQEQNPKKHLTIDSIREFRELTEIKLRSKQSGLLMVGGGVPKNFIQDTVVCAELLGKKVDMYKYAVQITGSSDTRDESCSSSTLKEASSWGKVDVSKEQMVFAEATSVLPLIASDAFHRQNWKKETKESFPKFSNKMRFLKQKDGFLGYDANTKIKSKSCCTFWIRKNCFLWDGTKNAPKEIIKASHQVELFDEELNKETYKYIGIKTLKPSKLRTK